MPVLCGSRCSLRGVSGMRRLPLPSLCALRGASVRLLLAGLDPADCERYVDRALADGARPPGNGREWLLHDIQRDSARGWAVSNDEIDEGIRSAAAPITDGDHRRNPFRTVSRVPTRRF
ncbi:IclR family transcriptional regulator C-terminal domain-containing protein [Streptomyces sp. NPDC046862]|uniref:IclR family transcriptional regulator domain-containing protein n=1 Tax=Streptomyces sp. NPDC046862 TaxID=3154603 RepID=UPI0034538B1F